MTDYPTKSQCKRHPFATFSNQYAIVTGSSTGIGKAIAMELATAGCNVLVHCNNSVAAAEKVVQKIRERGVQSDLIIADISNEQGLQHLFETAFKTFPNLDLWVNNAGIDLLTGDNAKLDSPSKLQALYETDIRSTVLLGQRGWRSVFQKQARSNPQHRLGSSRPWHGGT